MVEFSTIDYVFMVVAVVIVLLAFTMFFYLIKIAKKSQETKRVEASKLDSKGQKTGDNAAS